MKLRRVEPVVKEFIGRIREALGDRVKEIVLFGSHARGDAHKNSDYDIFLVVDKRDEKVRSEVYSLVAEFHAEKDVLFSVVIRDPEYRKYMHNFPFGANIEAEGITL